MSLVELIRKYHQNLAIPRGLDNHSVINRYKVFGIDLVELVPFTYRGSDMTDSWNYMVNLDFTDIAIRRVFQYAMRRVAIECIPDTNTREKIWELLEQANLETSKKIKEIKFVNTVKDYIERFGKYKLMDYLRTIQGGFKNFDRVLTSIYNKDIADAHRYYLDMEEFRLSSIISVVSKH